MDMLEKLRGIFLISDILVNHRIKIFFDAVGATLAQPLALIPFRIFL